MKIQQEFKDFKEACIIPSFNDIYFKEEEKKNKTLTAIEVMDGCMNQINSEEENIKSQAIESIKLFVALIKNNMGD